MKNRSVGFRRGVWALVVVIVIVAMGLGTKVVSGSALAATAPKVFSASDYGKKEFPKVKALILSKANDLSVVATAIQADATNAAKSYGVVEGTSFPVYSIKLTGVAGTVDAAGMLPITVTGMPGGIVVRVQTGPAISGTALRDATGTIHFPQFVNQIQYQDAGSALTDELKKQVLSSIKASDFAGKTVTVIGAFQLVNPASYLITPVQIGVN